MTIVGMAIWKYRKKNNLSQAEFGKKVGVNKQTVSRWEKGQLNPGTEKLFEIAQVVGVPFENLVENVDAQETAELLIFKEKYSYDVGLNRLFSNIHDFDSLCYFLDVLTAVRSLAKPGVSFLATIAEYSIYPFDNQHEEGQAVLDLDFDSETVSFNMIDGPFVINKERIYSVLPYSTFHNEVYAINILLKDKSTSFLQVVFLL